MPRLPAPILPRLLPGLDEMDRSIIAVSRLTLILFTFAASAFADIPGLTLNRDTNPPFHPLYLATAPNGNVWFSEEEIFPHSIGFVTPAGAVTKFQVPCA